MLREFNGNGTCTMELTTKVTMNKKGHKDMNYAGLPFYDVFEGDVYRTYVESANFNYNYENCVNNQRKREGNNDVFTAAPLPYGEWLEGGENKVYAHKNEFFLRYYIDMNANSNADKNVIFHYADGKELTEEEIKMIPEFQKPKVEKDNTESRQGTEKEIKPRGVKINGVNRLTVGGVTFKRA